MVLLIRFKDVKGYPAFVNPETVQSVEISSYRGQKDGQWQDIRCTTIFQRNGNHVDVTETSVAVAMMLMGRGE